MTLDEIKLQWEKDCEVDDIELDKSSLEVPKLHAKYSDMLSSKILLLKKYNQENINFLKENFSLDEITSKLLSIRKIKKDEVNSFLNPSIKNFLPNPYDITDMEKSTLRTAKAIYQKEKLGIFGDYDVDGATSTALLGNYFSELNLVYETYIPDRKKEGYGPSNDSFKYFIKKC